MSTYLSIDLDFWCKHNDPKSAIRFFRKVQGLNVPVTFFIEHDEMVEDIKKVKDLTKLYNVDYHSDIVAQKEKGYLQDYNWANFIPLSKNADYIWILPNMKCYDTYEGLCHADGIDPFENPKESGWKSCEYKTMSKIDWRNIKRVGVCISPIFVELHSINPILKKFDIDRKEIETLIEKQPYHPERRQKRMIKTVEAA